MMDKPKAVPSLETQIAPCNRVFSAWNHPDNLSGFNLKIQVTSAGAKTAGRQNSVHNGRSRKLYNLLELYGYGLRAKGERQNP